jgi:DMSO/TMAO reductase YedYZ heme-binding membrane subunit
MDEDASMVLFITLMPLYLSSSHYWMDRIDL